MKDKETVRKAVLAAALREFTREVIPDRLVRFQTECMSTVFEDAIGDGVTKEWLDGYVSTLREDMTTLLNHNVTSLARLLDRCEPIRLQRYQWVNLPAFQPVPTQWAENEDEEDVVNGGDKFKVVMYQARNAIMDSYNADDIYSAIYYPGIEGFLPLCWAEQIPESRPLLTELLAIDERLFDSGSCGFFDKNRQRVKGALDHLVKEAGSKNSPRAEEIEVAVRALAIECVNVCQGCGVETVRNILAARGYSVY